MKHSAGSCLSSLLYDLRCRLLSFMSYRQISAMFFCKFLTTLRGRYLGDRFWAVTSSCAAAPSLLPRLLGWNIADHATATISAVYKWHTTITHLRDPIHLSIIQLFLRCTNLKNANLRLKSKICQRAEPARQVRSLTEGTRPLVLPWPSQARGASPNVPKFPHAFWPCVTQPVNDKPSVSQISLYDREHGYLQPTT